jgi:hypothetical protein
MTGERKPAPEQQESLELNRETLHDLTELEAENVQGGLSTHPTALAVKPALARASAQDCTAPLR